MNMRICQTWTEAARGFFASRHREAGHPRLSSNIGWRFTCLLGVMIVAVPARADLQVIGRGGKDDTENLKLKTRFEKLLANARAKSPSFNTLMQTIDNKGDTTHHYRVIVTTEGDILDRASGPGQVTVNINNLEMLPDLGKDNAMPKTSSDSKAPGDEKKGSAPSIPKGTSAWWMTQGEDVAHFMGEATKTIQHIEYYTLDDKTGKWLRNQGAHTGEEYELDEDDHNSGGMTAQNAYRHDLGLGDGDRAQKNVLIYDTSDNSKFQFSYISLDEQKSTRTTGIWITYGSNKWEVINITSSGVQQHVVVGGSDHKEVPRPADSSLVYDKKKEEKKIPEKTSSSGGSGTSAEHKPRKHGKKSTGTFEVSLGRQKRPSQAEVNRQMQLHDGGMYSGH
jgi:hypothetical protein